MIQYKFNSLFSNNIWNKGGILQLHEQGLIQSLENSEPNSKSDLPISIIPGFINAHSHAFQYAMAGMAEIITGEQDTFWTWRKKMYQLALNLSPEEVEAIATMLYAEMIRNGYTHVVEFHYLHHQSKGDPYDNLAEMGDRLIAAAQRAGIGITLVPMFYQKGGFGRDAEDHQRRFISKSIDDYSRLLEATKKSVEIYSGANMGFGVHSLRAAEGEDIQSLVEMYPEIPFHIHIAEQMTEVEDCLAYHGMRPVEYLAHLIPLDVNKHLVHATHLTDQECKTISSSGAHVVLCPATEGNLGDGIFPFRTFLSQRGNWSIGSDSHVTLSPMEELRWLDYGQRLTSQRRNTIQDGQGTFGEELYKGALHGGQKAAGISPENKFVIGKLFSGVILDCRHPMLGEVSTHQMLNGLIYSGDSTAIKEVWSEGKCVMKGGRHIQQESIRNEFHHLIKQLKIRE